MALLWRSDRFRREQGTRELRTQTKCGRARHYGSVCGVLLQQYLDLPDTTVDVWLELHDRKAADRLKLTAGIPGWADLLFLEGNRWGYPSSSEERLLRRLGLIDGPRKCLWLEVWYREV